MAKKSNTKPTPALPHVSTDGLTVAEAGLAGLAIETTSEPETEPGEADTQDAPSEDDKTAAEMALAQASQPESPEITIAPPAPTSIALCDGGRFKVEKLAQVLSDCKSSEARTPTLVNAEKHRTNGKERTVKAPYDWDAVPVARLALTKAEIDVKRKADALGDALRKLAAARQAYQQD